MLLRRYVVRAPRMFVAVGGETLSGVTAVVQNAEHYTYFRARPVDLADGARLDDGALAGVVLRRASLLAAPSLALAQRCRDCASAGIGTCGRSAAPRR